MREHLPIVIAAVVGAVIAKVDWRQLAELAFSYVGVVFVFMMVVGAIAYHGWTSDQAIAAVTAHVGRVESDTTARIERVESDVATQHAMSDSATHAMVRAYLITGLHYNRLEDQEEDDKNALSDAMRRMKEWHAMRCQLSMQRTEEMFHPVAQHTSTDAQGNRHVHRA